jgi:hypothetical protein
MASKNPDAVVKAMLLSDKVDAIVPKNFLPYFNVPQDENQALLKENISGVWLGV